MPSGRRFGRFRVALLSLGLAASGAMAEEPPLEIPPEWPTGHYARIETDLGRIVARLLPRQAPQSVAHFAAAANGELSWTDPSGERKKFPYYDGIPIHFVRAGLLFEAGDWTGTGQGAPPLYVPQEGGGPVNFSQPGRLGMARPQRNPSALQFFATAAANPRLNRVFPCFGEIVEGREVVFQISQRKTYPNGKPIEEVRIRSLRTFQVGNPSPLPEPVQATYAPKKLEFRKELNRSEDP